MLEESDLFSPWPFGQRETQRKPKGRSKPFVSMHSIDMEPGSTTSGCIVFHAVDTTVHKKHGTSSDSIQSAHVGIS